MTKTISEQLDDLEILRAMRKLFRDSGRWIQGDLTNEWEYLEYQDKPTGWVPGYCLLGGFAKVQNMENIDDLNEEDLVKSRAAMVITEVILKHYKERTIRKVSARHTIEHTNPEDVIPNFNDHEATTIHDVRRVLRLAEQRVLREVEDI